ncbi:uncharacterized protein LOC111106029 [Rhizophagus clarus]|uniref:Uncharacterized protein LOC111106029 n=1 Tax=Rhizophagus clarus TaxID=94130 RepID=A0A8H3LF85_9GLOM|nr:uncharacterized protein LOC111106029 [Rhizophagus clarus]
MALTTLEKNRNAVNFFWQKKIRNAREISQRTGILLRSCERYVELLKKTEKVIFSDETTIQMFCNTLSAWSRDAKPIASMVKHPFKIHVWGAISVKGKIGMHMFIENLDRNLYRQILNEHLYDNANAMHDRRKEWDDLDNNVIVNCINSMRSRIEACIDAKGGHIKY